MRDNQPKLGVDSFSFEDWAQRHISRFNEMAALAIYPGTPSGVLDRYRLDELVVVPDGALPLVPLPNYGQMDGQPNESTHPNTADKSVDLRMGLPGEDASQLHESDHRRRREPVLPLRVPHPRARARSVPRRHVTDGTSGPAAPTGARWRSQEGAATRSRAPRSCPSRATTCTSRMSRA